MKKIVALLLALLMVFALVACGGGKEASGQVQLYSTMTEADLEALIACFNEKYPNIEVVVTNGSAGELTARIDGEKGNPQGDLV